MKFTPAADTVINIDSRPYLTAEISGRVVSDDGRPTFEADSASRWNAILGRCVGKLVRLRLIRPKRTRTNAQNRMLWGLTYPDILEGLHVLAEEAGEQPVFEDVDELHDALKWKFLRRTEGLHGAGEIERVPRSSKLTIEQFSHYVDEVCKWAAERGIYVRHPGEKWDAA